MTIAVWTSAACVVATGALLVAERRQVAWARAVCKLAAGAAFVATALALGATDTVYGRWILVALVLGVVGDALLLSDRDRAFTAGLAVFLASHLAFGAAFVGGPVSGAAAAAGAAVAVAAGVVVWRWLAPHLARGWRAPVAAYVVTILAMCVAAAGRAGATGDGLVLAGAVLFAASDLAVARERFVARGFGNKAFGLPAYFAAQLLMAASVTAG